MGEWAQSKAQNYSTNFKKTNTQKIRNFTKLRYVLIRKLIKNAKRSKFIITDLNAMISQQFSRP